MSPRPLTLIVAMAMACLAAAGHASNMRFLEFSPSASFTDKDWELLRQAARDTLNNADNGETRTWKNEQSGHHGRLTPLKTYEDFGTTCRQLKVFNEAGDVSATRVVVMCKNKEGQWKILQ